MQVFSIPMDTLLFKFLCSLINLILLLLQNLDLEIRVAYFISSPSSFSAYLEAEDLDFSEKNQSCGHISTVRHNKNKQTKHLYVLV